MKKSLVIIILLLSIQAAYSKEPYKIGKKNYNVEEAHSMKCEKRGLSKF